MINLQKVVETAVESYKNYSRKILKDSKETALLPANTCSSYVYLAQSKNNPRKFKIGRSIKPSERMKSLRQGYGDFCLRGYRQFRRADVVERGLHCMFSHCHLGRELFLLNKDEVSQIESFLDSWE